jgi:adhesin/invasin
VAYTPGNEGFDDINGNNVYDEGIDILTMDMSEPYIDANDNSRYDSGEKYIDSDGNGSFTEADGRYQSNTIIWDSANVLFSAEQAPLNLRPANFTYDGINGGTYSFTYYLRDEYGKALVGGTHVKVDAEFSSTVGSQVAGPSHILTGDTDFILPDSPGPGQTYSFSLIIDPYLFSYAYEGSIKVIVEVTPNTGRAGANSDVKKYDESVGTYK